MKVLVPAVASSSEPDGITRHAVNLVLCLMQRPEIGRVNLVVGDWQKRSFLSLLKSIDPKLRDLKLRLHLVNTKQSSLERNLWYYQQLPGLALASDIVHLSYPAPLARSRVACPVLVTLHDLYPYDLPENFGYPRVFFNRFILRQCLAAVDGIACVSEATLARLRFYHHAFAERATCIYNCVPKEQPSPAPLPGLAEHAPFVLAVAQHRQNKNIPLTLAIFRRLAKSHPELKLFLVGINGPETHSIREALKDEHLQGRVVLLQGITDQQLQWCYQQCVFLLATSTLEGFGLPVAEALLAGCQVVCSDIAAFREVGWGHCHFVKAGHGEEQAFVEAAEEALKKTRLLPISLPQFSSTVIGEQYMRLYRGLLAQYRKTNPSANRSVMQKVGNA